MPDALCTGGHGEPLSRLCLPPAELATMLSGAASAGANALRPGEGG